jgi:DNA helicase-2/ATP-dependent DNA helicase PcrA
MDTWVDIRRKARVCHEKALATAKGDRRASQIIAGALQNDDLELRRINFADGLLGSLDRPSLLVNVATGLSTVDEAVVVAHEIGHFHLHHDPHNEVTVVPQSLGGDSIDNGAGKVEGYSGRERKEVQANIFAAEFLCPADWLRAQYLDHGKRAETIANELGLPLSLVLNQLIRALSLAPIGVFREVPDPIRVELDESQLTAVKWDKGPLLVDAGPGTGKTRTLVGRIAHLLETGARASSFLALTFSNKAAEEMRERLATMNAEAAIEMWVGTFHAFGLELITKWPTTIQRSSKVRVLDQAGSLALLEANLEKLPLHHFQNLYEPAYELVLVLRVISRCKDELVSVDDYHAAAQADMAKARTTEEIEAAEKILEVAAIYRIYEEALREADAVDFGDLIKLTIELIHNNADVQKYVAGFTHVMVDEFQDVNFASAELLKAIRGPLTSMWVVADQRQSIYRFRGAEPSNVATFTSTFGGTRHSLTKNYRSFSSIVRTFESFSNAMHGGTVKGRWEAHRLTGGGVSLTVTPTLAAEAEAIREKIEAWRKAGVPYRDQAILGRSHLTLARLTSILENLNVPLLYLGDLFERPEIRDLLSLLSIDAEFGGVGVVRIAALAPYNVPRADSLRLIEWAMNTRVRIHDALARLSEIEGLSETGVAGLSILAVHLQGLSTASPWTLLTTWLFDRSEYLAPILRRSDPKAQQQLIAIYHLLSVCSEFMASGEASRKKFLAHIRRIELLNEDISYRAVSSEASDVDAVRVMTIHGSKGLEFPAVHFPALATGYMPSSWRGVRIQAPTTLARLAMTSDGHSAEEECLFFVALSRARDHLSLSRAEKYTTRKASESKLLATIAGLTSTRQYQGSGKTYVDQSPLSPVDGREIYTEREIEIYQRCPARYRYEVIEHLRGARDDSAYIRFHRSVYMTVGWLEKESEAGHPVDASQALAHLAGVWATEGPTDHGFENYYRHIAEDMVKAMLRAVARETGKYDRREWAVPIGDRKILVTPDRVILTPNGTVRVQRIRTGRKTKSEIERPIYALLRRGAALAYPGRPVSIEAFYLGTDEVVPILPHNDEKQLQQYRDAIASIEAGKFQPEPEPRQCPNCQCYFICAG